MIDILKREYDRLSKVGDNNMHLYQLEDEVLPFLEFVIGHFGKQDFLYFMEIGLAFGGNFKLMGSCLGLCSEEVYGIAVDKPVDKRWKHLNFTLREALYQYRADFSYYLIIGNSRNKNVVEQVEECLGGCSLDLLFIDGDHTYNGCKSDFDIYSKLVRPGGLIAFHDIRGAKHGSFQVWKFWNELKKKYEHREFAVKKEDNGIGVLVYT